MNREKLIPILKWVVYSFLLVIAFALQTTPRLFELFGIKPVLILPLAICISMYEGVMSSAVFGMVTGLLWDISSDKVFGFNAIILVVICSIISLLCIYYLRTKIFNFFCFCAVTLLLQGLLDYLFYYALWGYENKALVFTTSILPTIGYTMVISPIIFILVKAVARKFHMSARI